MPAGGGADRKHNARNLDHGEGGSWGRSDRVIQVENSEEPSYAALAQGKPWYAGCR